MGEFKLPVKRIGLAWPKVKVIYRGDSGCCRWKTVRWCDNNDVCYILGLPKNYRINDLSVRLREEFRSRADRCETKNFGRGAIRPGAWDRERRVAVKAEHLSKGANPGYSELLEKQGLFHKLVKRQLL